MRRTTSGSETVVTPGTMTCIAVTHPPRSDVDQLAATTCDTSAGNFFFFWLPLNIIVRYDKYVLKN